MEIKSESISNVPKCIKVQLPVGKHMYIRYNIGRGRETPAYIFSDWESIWVFFQRYLRCLVGSNVSVGNL